MSQLMPAPNAKARKSGGITALVGLAIALVAFIITMPTNTHATTEGGTYFVLYGPILLGIILLISGAVQALRTPKAQWYPDPAARHERRYRDGKQWTARVMDKGQETTDELEPAPAGR